MEDVWHNTIMASDSTVLERVIQPDAGELSPELARRILAFDFPPPDHARYEALCAKASDGTLNEQERTDLEEYLDVNDFLTVIKAKAKSSLRREHFAT